MYGNRDLAAYEEGRRDLEKITRRFKAVPGPKIKKQQHVLLHSGGENEAGNSNSGLVNGNDDSRNNEPPVKGLDAIPKPVAKAYLERLAAELLEKAAAL